MFSVKLKQKIKALDSASAFFFVTGALLFKLQIFMATPIIAVILNFSALSLYGIGYGVWLIESLFKKDSRQLPDKWFGFASLEEQSFYCCAIGLAGTLVGIIAIFLPILLIPTCWIFALSNTIWLIGEYQKINLPQESHVATDPDYRHAKQVAYFNFAVIVALISVVTAIIATVSFFFPPFLWVSVLVGPYLGGMVIKSWIDVSIVHPITEKIADKKITSYEVINGAAPPVPETTCASSQTPTTDPLRREIYGKPSRKACDEDSLAKTCQF